MESPLDTSKARAENFVREAAKSLKTKRPRRAMSNVVKLRLKDEDREPRKAFRGRLEAMCCFESPPKLRLVVSLNLRSVESPLYAVVYEIPSRLIRETDVKLFRYHDLRLVYAHSLARRLKEDLKIKNVRVDEFTKEEEPAVVVKSKKFGELVFVSAQTVIPAARLLSHVDNLKLGAKTPLYNAKLLRESMHERAECLEAPARCVRTSRAFDEFLKTRGPWFVKFSTPADSMLVAKALHAHAKLIDDEDVYSSFVTSPNVTKSDSEVFKRLSDSSLHFLQSTDGVFSVAKFPVAGAETSSRALELDSVERASELMIGKVLRRGLPSSVVHIEDAGDSWRLFVTSEKFSTQIPLIKGPDTSQTEECARFRDLWGEASELRRFKNGAVHECVLFESETCVVLQALRVLLSRLGCPIERVSEKFAHKSTTPNDLSTHSTERSLADDYVRGLRALVSKAPLPLEIKSIQAGFNKSVWIDFESSSRWPDAQKAFRTMEIAFLIALRKTIKRGTIDLRHWKPRLKDGDYSIKLKAKPQKNPSGELVAKCAFNAALNRLDVSLNHAAAAKRPLWTAFDPKMNAVETRARDLVLEWLSSRVISAPDHELLIPVLCSADNTPMSAARIFANFLVFVSAPSFRGFVEIENESLRWESDCVNGACSFLLERVKTSASLSLEFLTLSDGDLTSLMRVGSDGSEFDFRLTPNSNPAKKYKNLSGGVATAVVRAKALRRYIRQIADVCFDTDASTVGVSIKRSVFEKEPSFENTLACKPAPNGGLELDEEDLRATFAHFGFGSE